MIDGDLSRCADRVGAARTRLYALLGMQHGQLGPSLLLASSVIKHGLACTRTDDQEAGTVSLAIAATDQAVHVSIREDGADTPPALIARAGTGSDAVGDRTARTLDRVAARWGVTRERQRSNVVWFQVGRDRRLEDVVEAGGKET